MGSFIVTQENGEYVFYPNTNTFDDFRMTESEARLIWPPPYQLPIGERVSFPKYYLDAVEARAKARSLARASSPSIGTKDEAVAQISHGVSVLNLGQSSTDNTNLQIGMRKLQHSLTSENFK